MATHELTEMIKQADAVWSKGNLWAVIYRKGHAGVVAEFSVEERKELRELAVGIGKIGYCYQNAQIVAIRALADPRVKYIEGLVSVYGVPIDHAWIEFNGKVFDPTLRSLKTFEKKQSGPENEYYGMEVPKKLIMPNQLEMETYSPLTQWPAKYAEELIGEEKANA